MSAHSIRRKRYKQANQHPMNTENLDTRARAFMFICPKIYCSVKVVSQRKFFFLSSYSRSMCFWFENLLIALNIKHCIRTKHALRIDTDGSSIFMLLFIFYHVWRKALCRMNNIAEKRRISLRNVILHLYQAWREK